MRRLWHALLALLDETERATSLALFRAALGLCTLALIGTAVARDLPAVLWADKGDGGYRALGSGYFLIELFGGPTAAFAWTCAIVALVGGALVFVGLAGRASAFVTLVAVNLLVLANGEVASGYDRLLTNGLWLLVLSSSTATLSLDCRLATGRFTSTREVKAWPRYLAIFQLVVVYWIAGLNKVGAAWTPAGGFSAIYYILMQPDWQRFDMRFLAWLYPLTQVATATTWLWELSWPVVLLWFLARRRTSPQRDPARPPPRRFWRALARYDVRLGYLAVGVLMHTFTWVFMEVGPFSFITMSFYLCLLSPDELARARRWLVERRAARREPTPG